MLTIVRTCSASGVVVALFLERDEMVQGDYGISGVTPCWELLYVVRRKKLHFGVEKQLLCLYQNVTVGQTIHS